MIFYQKIFYKIKSVYNIMNVPKSLYELIFLLGYGSWLMIMHQRFKELCKQLIDIGFNCQILCLCQGDIK